MRQILFSLHLAGHTLPVYGYGMMLVLAFLACTQVAKFLGRRSGIDPEVFINAGLIALITGVIGARASHVVENFSAFTNPRLSAWQNFQNIINIRSGGLTFYGGLFLATPCCIAYGIAAKVPLRRGMDIVAPCVVLGLAIGRIGCFLNGCCYGERTDSFLGVRFPFNSVAYIDQYDAGLLKPPPQLLNVYSNGAADLKTPAQIAADPSLQALAAQQHALPVLPTQLYSTATALLIMAILLCYYTLPHAPGQVFAMLLIIEGPSRFLLELLRVEPPVWGPLSLSMVLGLILLPVGVALWIIFGKLPARRDFGCVTHSAASLSPSPLYSGKRVG